MFQYRIALAQMRRGASDREIARSHCMGRHKLAELRALAEQHGWLDTRTPLPEDAEIAAALGTPKLAASAPFDRPSDGFAFFVLALDVDERMRIAEHKLRKIAFDRHLLVFKVSGGKRVMGIQRHAGHQRSRGNQ